MSATDAFKRVFRSATRSLVVLVKLTTRHPVTLAPTDYYFASTVCDTPAGTGFAKRVWKPKLLDSASVIAPGSFADTDLGLCSASFVLEASALDMTTTLLDGATASIWLWADSFTTDPDTGVRTPDLTSFDDALCVLKNATVLSWSCSATEISVVVRQRTDWNRDIVPVEVTAEAYPHAPEDSLGQNLPVVYGKMSDDTFRPPWPDFPQVDGVAGASTFTKYLSLLLGGRRVGAAVLVDTGRGAGAATNPKARVLAASHKCKTVNDLSQGCGFYAKMGDKLVALEPVDPVNDIINTTTEAGMLIPDNAALAWVATQPSDVDVVANSAENPRAVLDPWNDSNWARLDWTAGYKTLRMKLAPLDDTLGEMTEVYCFVGYRSAASTNLKIRFRNTTTGVTFDASLPVSATRKVVMFRIQTAWVAPLPTQPWSLSEVELEAGWPTSAPAVTGTGTAEIYFAGLAVHFKPRQNLVESERIFEHTETRPVTRPGHGRGPRGGDTIIWEPYTVRETIPATTELLGKFFANIEGYADDGEFAAAGSFTGASGALIQRAPDILAHMLVRYGGESLAKVEQGVGAFGSFVDARSLLQDPRKRDMAFALSIGQSSDVMTALTWVAQSSVSLVVLDRFTDKWKFIPWRTDQPADYDWTFKPEDLVERDGPDIQRPPASRVVSGVALGYAYDAASKNFQHQTRLAWNGSSSGFKYRGLRDEKITLDSSNDKFDFTTTAAKTCDLSAHWGDYDGPSFAAMLSAQVSGIDGAQSFLCTWGPTIVQGYNDELFYNDGNVAVDRTVTIPEGTYTSFEALCAAVSAAVDAANGAAPTNFVYSRTTRKVTCSRVSGSLWLYAGSGSMASRRLLATLGYATSATIILGGASVATASHERAEECFVFACITNPVDLNWETGVNGLKGLKRNCASVMGFSTLRDNLSGGTTRSWLGDTPKNNREAQMLQAAKRYGAKRDTVEDLRAVGDTDTAREIRNRLAALLCRPRLVVTFSTDKAPDIERGRVISFTSDFDAVRPYPDPDTDGSWLGKRFVVVEVEQILGPAAFYTKVRAVALD